MCEARTGWFAATLLWVALLGPISLAAGAHVLSAQEAAGASGGVPSRDSDPSPAGAAGPRDLQQGLPSPTPLPVKVILGLSYGIRVDDCVLCANPQDNKSFSGHLSVVRPLYNGIGVGLDASVWRRGRPGTPLPPDSTGTVQGTTLANTLGNLSVSFSYEASRVFVRAGVGAAYGAQAREVAPPPDPEADPTDPPDADLRPLVDTASGFGVGYSVGGGVTVPIASVVSLAFYLNWNEGFYDMLSPLGTTARDARHRYLEMGIGVALR